MVNSRFRIMSEKSLNGGLLRNIFSTKILVGGPNIYQTSQVHAYIRHAALRKSSFLPSGMKMVIGMLVDEDSRNNPISYFSQKLSIATGGQKFQRHLTLSKRSVRSAKNRTLICRLVWFRKHYARSLPIRLTSPKPYNVTLFLSLVISLTRAIGMSRRCFGLASAENGTALR